MSRLESELDRKRVVTNLGHYDIRMQAARDYFDGKLSSRAYRDFKNQHPFFSAVKIGPVKLGL